MSASRDSAGILHSIQKFLLVIPGVFPREFDFYVDSSTIRNTMPHDVTLAMLANMNDGAVFGVELAYRVISCDAAVLTEGYDDLVL